MFKSNTSQFHQPTRCQIKYLLPPDSDSDGSEGEEQSTGMQSKKVPSSPENAFSFLFLFNLFYLLRKCKVGLKTYMW